MNTEEAKAFEKRPDFEAILKMRQWDDQAKDPAIPAKSYDEMEQLCRKILTE